MAKEKGIVEAAVERMVHMRREGRKATVPGVFEAIDQAEKLIQSGLEGAFAILVVNQWALDYFDPAAHYLVNGLAVHVANEWDDARCADCSGKGPCEEAIKEALHAAKHR